MNHTNGHQNMTRLGKALSQATKAPEGSKPSTTQKPQAIQDLYDLGTLGVESALPLFMEVSHVTA